MKQLLIMLLILCSTSVSAQDVIVKKDGSTIACRAVELTSSEITYKKWNDLSRNFRDCRSPKHNG